MVWRKSQLWNYSTCTKAFLIVIANLVNFQPLEMKIKLALYGNNTASIYVTLVENLFLYSIACVIIPFSFLHLSYILLQHFSFIIWHDHRILTFHFFPSRKKEEFLIGAEPISAQGQTKLNTYCLLIHLILI